MRISASELIMLGKGTPAENAEKIASIVPEVELMMDADPWEFGPNGWDEQAESLKDLDIPFSVHPPAWDMNVASPIKPLRDAAAFLNHEALKLAIAIGAKQMVFHPGCTDCVSNFDRIRAIDNSYAILDELILKAKPLGITLAFENIAGPSRALFSAEEYVHALDGIDPCVRYLLDIGHANMNHWEIPKVIERIADRVCGFHLHDNDGSGDLHWPILTGTVDWEGTFSVMRELPSDVLYVLEYQTNTDLNELKKGVNVLLEEIG